jgi:hypothetical protein
MKKDPINWVFFHGALEAVPFEHLLAWLVQIYTTFEGKCRTRI